LGNAQGNEIENILRAEGPIHRGNMDEYSIQNPNGIPFF
jgi:hypothetical protein